MHKVSPEEAYVQLRMAIAGVVDSDTIPDEMRPKIKHIEIPDYVTRIGSDAFINCTSLTSVTIGDSVESIGSGAFYNCTSLANVMIPDSAIDIGDYAFYNCKALASIKIPSFVTCIGYHAFSNCKSLKSISLPADIKERISYWKEAFKGIPSYCKIILRK